MKFVQGFIDFSNANLESLLIKENVAFAEGELKDAQKEQSKIEKAIENNLKDQQKLGKKLDSSPELIAKAMSEKEEITSQLFTDSVAVLDDKAKTNLSKASQKKDREISKIEKNAKKAESNLEKKERELEDLKEELISAKTRVKAYQKALSDSKSLSIQKK
jgi:chromosome segregation ATPase